MKHYTQDAQGIVDAAHAMQRLTEAIQRNPVYIATHAEMAIWLRAETLARIRLLIREGGFTVDEVFPNKESKEQTR